LSQIWYIFKSLFKLFSCVCSLQGIACSRDAVSDVYFVCVCVWAVVGVCIFVLPVFHPAVTFWCDRQDVSFVLLHFFFVYIYFFFRAVLSLSRSLTRCVASLSFLMLIQEASEGRFVRVTFRCAGIIGC